MSGAGVDYVQSNLEEAPFCCHGPTIKFERFYSAAEQSKESTQFFACAVYRSRKQCNFYHPTKNQISTDKRQQYYKHYTEYQESLLASVINGALDIVLRMDSAERCICETCGVLLINERMMDDHSGHTLRHGLCEKQLLTPTSLLRPHDDNKGQAQYFFSTSSQSLLLTEIKRMKKTHVICMGVPRLHEELIRTGKAHSFLLDIDHRFVQFYSNRSFQRFNMFNGFFYSNDEGLQCLRSFIKSSSGPEDILLVVDPPFGGLVTALKTGIEKVWSINESELHTVLVFPYFNEHHVIESFPAFYMMDYQVTYEGHPHFNDKRTKRPSPVRMYTNLPLPGLMLPRTEGYRLCKICNRYVHSNNAHCKDCDKCTSKDGRPYKHCDVCSICVKQSYVHCDKCGLCALHTHECKKIPKIGCHICGSMSHKRRDCPSRVVDAGGRRSSRKRQQTCSNSVNSTNGGLKRSSKRSKKS